MQFDTYEYKIPTWAVIALEYGDYSGLEDDDIAAIESFVSELPRNPSGSVGIFSWPDESYFSWSNDVSDPGSDVYDVEYLVEAYPILNPDMELPLI
jgi:hypothetical protein